MHFKHVVIYIVPKTIDELEVILIVTSSITRKDLLSVKTLTLSKATGVPYNYYLLSL